DVARHGVFTLAPPPTAASSSFPPTHLPTPRHGDSRSTCWHKFARPHMTPTYRVDLQKASSGYDRETCWVQARCGVVPGAGDDRNPLGVLTMQKLWIKASDSFFDLHSLTSGD